MANTSYSLFCQLYICRAIIYVGETNLKLAILEQFCTVNCFYGKKWGFGDIHFLQDDNRAHPPYISHTRISWASRPPPHTIILIAHSTSLTHDNYEPLTLPHTRISWSSLPPPHKTLITRKNSPTHPWSWLLIALPHSWTWLLRTLPPALDNDCL